MKIAPRSRALHEWETLLALPEGLAPRPLDVRPAPDGAIVLVQELLSGRTLLEAAPGLRPEDLPLLALSVGRRLEALHASGFLHADLKPANIFLEEGRPFSIRLIDLESARSPHAPAGLAADPAWDRITPGFGAPELLSGWSVDGRADLYSLGIILRSLASPTDLAWEDILDRLTAKAPSARWADASTFCRKVEERFRLRSRAPTARAFASGALLGRSRDLRLFEAWARHPERGRLLLVQARRGTGLSRFLRETALAGMREDRDLRIVDLGDLGRRPRGEDVTRAVLLVEECLASGERVALGVPHLSPAFHWPGRRPHAGLASLAGSEAPDRLYLPPLDRETLEAMASMLPFPPGTAEALISVLHENRGGDLKQAEKVIGLVLRGYGQDAELPGRTWREIPPDLRSSLSILARIADSLDEGIARRILEELGPPAVLDQLVQRGLLVSWHPGKLAFEPPHLRRQALACPPEDAAGVDAWLCANYLPPAEDFEAALSAARRSRAAGDKEQEQFHLLRALEVAVRDLNWTALRILLGYQGEWSEENALVRSGDLHSALGDTWSPDRVLHFAGLSLHHLGSSLGLRLLELNARRERTRWGMNSLVELASLERSLRSGDACERRWELIETLRREGFDPIPGIVEHERAKFLWSRGEREQALARLAIAAPILEGTGLPQEAELYMLRGVLSFSGEPEQALATVRRGIDRTALSTWRAMLHLLLSQFHESRGELEEAERNARLALENVGPVGGIRQSARIRAQLGWCLLWLDRAREAAVSAEQLLDHPVVRREPFRLDFLRVLAGIAALHQGRGREAVTRLSTAWSQRASNAEADRSASLLRHLLDALLDLGASDLVREHEPELTLGAPSRHPSVILVESRAAALKASAQCLPGIARALLEENLALVRKHPQRIEAARYLHHRGVVLLDLAGCKGEAIESFSEALGLFGASGYGYYRSRSLLGLARARLAGGETAGAREALDEAVTLSRRIGSAGVLVEALQERAAWNLSRGSS